MNPAQYLFVTLIKAGNFATPASAKLYQTAMSCLGRDASPSDKADDEFACAESVNEIVFRAFGDYAGATFRPAGCTWLSRTTKNSQKVTSPIKGDIVISPTGYGNGSMPNGPRRHHGRQRSDHVQQLEYRPVGHPFHFSFMESAIRRPGRIPDGLLPPHVHVAIITSHYHHAHCNFSSLAPVRS
jgi:hypothetical protein